jgi:hypothetical protein
MPLRGTAPAMTHAAPDLGQKNKVVNTSTAILPSNLATKKATCLLADSIAYKLVPHNSYFFFWKSLNWFIVCMICVKIAVYIITSSLHN